jgi:hypothetical protein
LVNPYAILKIVKEKELVMMAKVEISDNLFKVFEYFNENSLWDDIFMQDGFDHDGDHYSIFDGWDDVEKFEVGVREVLGLGENDSVENALETNIVFSDEYSICDDCRHVIRTSPDSYSWQPDYYIGDGFIVCGDCFRDNSDYQTDYLEDKINNPKSAVNGLLSEEQIEELGFTKYNSDSYENGWHYGQNDSPEKIYDNLKGEYEEILFYIDGTGQFDIHFSVWVK